MKKSIAALTLAMAISLTGCSTNTTTATDNCITILVDFQSLDNNNKSVQCLEATANTKAADIVAKAGFTIEGTDKYGLQIVCRVNGLPSATQVIGSHTDYRETCAEMPAEFAYWALLIRTPKQDWQYAPVGIADLTLNPGEQMALVFSLDEAMVLPN